MVPCPIRCGLIEASLRRSGGLRPATRSTLCSRRRRRRSTAIARAPFGDGEGCRNGAMVDPPWRPSIVNQPNRRFPMIRRILVLLLALISFAVWAAVDANKGTAAELDSIKGIGPAISTKIVDERKKGNFKDWADFISRVSGVGEKSAGHLSEAGLTVNGQSFKGAAPSAKAEEKKAAKTETPAKAEKAAAADEGKKAKQESKAEKKAAKTEAAA